MTGNQGNKNVLIAAVLDWADDRPPNDPGDAELMKAIWRYSGPIETPCEGCGGDCGEACAPCSVEAACASLDRFIEDWRKRRGLAPLVRKPAP
jgi:hypothetical protein